jgi:hypothetical protein
VLIRSYHLLEDVSNCMGYERVRGTYATSVQRAKVRQARGYAYVIVGLARLAYALSAYPLGINAKSGKL